MLVPDILPLLAVPRLHRQNIADGSAMDQINRFADGRRAPTLRADLHDAIVLPRRLDQQPAFVHVVRTRLLDIHMLAGRHRQQHRGRVPMVRRRNPDGVKRPIFQHPAQVPR